MAACGMPYRKPAISRTWHWCHNCSGWPETDFTQREDKPETWGGQSLCDECASRDCRGACQHSVALRTGLPSDMQEPFKLV
jgi:hypothetical protein